MRPRGVKPTGYAPVLSRGNILIEDFRKNYFDAFHRNDCEFGADSGLLIPLDIDTTWIWPKDPAMVRS